MPLLKRWGIRAALKVLRPALAFTSRSGWEDLTWELQSRVAFLETNLATLKANSRHDTD